MTNLTSRNILFVYAPFVFQQILNEYFSGILNTKNFELQNE